MRNRRLLLIGILAPSVCIGAAGIAWQVRTRGPVDQAASASGTEDRSGGAAEKLDKAASPTALSRAGWKVGSKYVYDVAVQLTFAQVAQGQAAGPGDSTRLEIKGTYSTTVVREKDGLSDVRVEFEPTTLALGQLEPDKAAALKLELSQPLVVRYDVRGMAREIFFTGRASGLVRGLQRELVSTYQLTSSDPPQVEWTVAELDPTGEVAVAYTRLRDGRYSRRKLKYTRIATAKGLVDAAAVQVVPKIDLASALYTLDDAGRIKEILSRASATANPEALGVVFKSANLTTFKLVRSWHDAALAQNDPTHGMTRSALHVDSNAFADAEANSLRQIVGNATAPELLKRMKTARSKNEPMQIGDAQHKMEALLRLEPQRIPEVIQEVRAGRGDLHALDAVAGVGTPEAQQQLVSLAADKAMPMETREAAIEAMHSVQEPTDEALTGLGDMMGSDERKVRRSASYAYGTLAGKLAENDPDAARRHLEKLNADYDAATTEEERIRVLEAIGNAARPEVLAPIQKALASQSEPLRTVAAKALRLVEDPQADGILSTLMLSESSAVVREGAFFAASFRKFEPFEKTLVSIFRQGKPAPLRGQALSLLATYYERDGAPGATSLLTWVAANDEDKLLRENAQRALTRKKAA
jgi:HEAT repeat protein